MGIKPRTKTAGVEVLSNRYISSCSICDLGIFRDQPDRPYHWSRYPLGLVHTDCVPEVTP